MQFKFRTHHPPPFPAAPPDWAEFLHATQAGDFVLTRIAGRPVCRSRVEWVTEKTLILDDGNTVARQKGPRFACPITPEWSAYFVKLERANEAVRRLVDMTEALAAAGQRVDVPDEILELIEAACLKASEPEP